MVSDASATGTYDIIVIGGGPPGENVAQYAIQGTDRTAAIVEAELVGGECSYWACMPSKALLRPIDVLEAARAMPGVQQMVQGPLDVAAVLARRDSFTHNRDDASQVEWATSHHIAVVRGRGRLAGERTVQVSAADGSTTTLTARHAVVIATGTTAAVPDLPGLRDALPWTSRDVTNLREVPRRVVVIGGGVVACESATWLRGLGAEEVTLVVRGPRLLEALEPFAGEAVATAFQERGITVLTGASVKSVSRPDVKDTGIGLRHGGPATISVGGKVIEVDEVVVAAGRTPASEGIGLDTVGVSTDDRGFVTTDDHMEVSGGWLYAVGDICGRALLTHMGKYQARVCGDVIAARAEGRSTEGSRYRDLADHDMVPAVIFSAPEVASVGLTEAKARDKGIDVEILAYELGNVAGASLLRDGYQGRAQLVVDRSTDLIVGATFVGPDVAELLHAATTAIVGRVTTEMLWHVVPSYPTVSEVWLRLLETRNPV